MIVTIILSGCDDETRFEVDVAPEQMEFLKLLESTSKEIGGGCMPVLFLEGGEAP